MASSAENKCSLSRFLPSWMLPGTPRKAGQGGVAARRAGLGLEHRHPNQGPLALEEVGTAGGTFWGSQHLRAWLRTFRKL